MSLGRFRRRSRPVPHSRDGAEDAPGRPHCAPAPAAFVLALVGLIAAAGAFGADGESGVSAALPDGAVLRLDRVPDADGPGVPLDSLREVVFSPDGSRLALRGEPEDPSVRRRILVYDLRARRFTTTIWWNVSLVTRLAFSADGRTLAASTPDAPSGVQTWNAADGTPVRGLPSGRGPFLLLERGAQVGILAPAGKNEVLRVHNLQSGEEVQRFILPVSYQSEFSGDGLKMAATLRFGDSDVRLLDLRSAKELKVLRGAARPPSVMRFAPDGRTLAAGFSDRTAQLWELSTGEAAFRLSGSLGTIFAAAFSPDGRLLATAGTEPVVRVWEVATGREVHAFRGHAKPVSTLAFSPDGRLLASGSFDRTVLVWNAALVTKSFLPSEPLDEKGLTKLWDDLAAAAPAASYPAIGRLRATAEGTLPVIRERVRLSLVPIEKSRIDQLIRNLGDPDSLVRHRATDDLRKLRDVARPALARAVKESASAEVRSRARRLLTLADDQPRFSPGDIRRMQRLIHAVEGVPGPDAEAILEIIGREFPDPAVARDANDTLARLRRK